MRKLLLFYCQLPSPRAEVGILFCVIVKCRALQFMDKDKKSFTLSPITCVGSKHCTKLLHGLDYDIIETLLSNLRIKLVFLRFRSCPFPSNN